MRDITGLVQVATAQQGLLTIHQARELGVDDHGLATICRAGAFERIGRGVYRVAGSPETWEQRLASACLSGLPPAAASHRAALRIWDLRTVDHEVEATVRRPKCLRVEGAIIHRSVDLELADVTWFDGIPVTSPVRTICDAGLIFPEHEVQRILDHAVATGLVTVDDLWRFRRRVAKQGRNGVGVLHRALEALPDGAESTESGPEIALLRLCHEYELPTPAIQFPIVVAGERFRPDLAYPEARILLEYDGLVVHTDPDRFVEDRRRQNAMLLDGWTVLRFSKDDLRDRPSRVAAEIRRALTGFWARSMPKNDSERA